MRPQGKVAPSQASGEESERGLRAFAARSQRSIVRALVVQSALLMAERSSFIRALAVEAVELHRALE